MQALILQTVQENNPGKVCLQPFPDHEYEKAREVAEEDAHTDGTHSKVLALQGFNEAGEGFYVILFEAGTHARNGKLYVTEHTELVEARAAAMSRRDMSTVSLFDLPPAAGAAA